MLYKTSHQVVPKLLCFAISLSMLITLSCSQIAEENFTKYANFTMDDIGKMTFNRKVLDKDLGGLKDESSYSFFLGKLREFNDQNQIIRDTSSLKFIKEEKEKVVFMDQNATRLTFKSSFNTTAEDKFYNPNAVLRVFVYFFQNNFREAKKGEFTSSKVYVKFNLTDYEFCDENSNIKNCIQTPASENKTAVYHVGKYLEFEFGFASSVNKNYKVFTDMDMGITESGDFMFVMMSEFKQDGDLKLIESKDIKLSKDKAIMRFPKFQQSVVVSSFIDTNFSEKYVDDKPSEIVRYKTNNSVEISIDPQGGMVSFTKLDAADPTKNKYLKISLVSLAEKDKEANKLGTFNNLDHFIQNLTVYSFKTEEFRKDNYEKIPVRKSRFYLKGIPKEDTIIDGDLVIFEQKGRIVLDGYRGIDIKPGDIKLYMEVLNWPFCRYNSFGSAQNCPAENPNDPPKEGSALEFKLDFSGKVTPHRLQYSEDRYSMEDLSYIFTGNVNVDDRIEKINFNDIKVENVENSNIITTKFPVFSKKASFQVVIDMNKPEGPHIIFIVLIGLLALFVAGFIIFMCISKKITKAHSDPSLLPK